MLNYQRVSCFYKNGMWKTTNYTSKNQPTLSLWQAHLWLGHHKGHCVMVLFESLIFHLTLEKTSFPHSHGYGSIPINPFLVGWTSIYQLFWCSPGVQGFDTLPHCYHVGADLYETLSTVGTFCDTQRRSDWDLYFLRFRLRAWHMRAARPGQLSPSPGH